MSTLLPAHAVLLNADLLPIVLEHVPRADICNIRLCNKALSTIASPYMFRTLLVSSREQHLDRLTFVSAHNIFRRGVREIIWESTAYIIQSEWDESDFWYLGCQIGLTNCLFKDWDGLPKDKAHAIVARLEALAEEEKELWDAEPTEKHIHDTLATALKKLEGLNHMVLTSWYGGEGGPRGYLDHDILSIDPKHPSPPPMDWLVPLAKIMNRFLMSERQDQALCVIFKALSSSGRKVLRFTVTPFHNVLVSHRALDMGFCGVLTTFGFMHQLAPGGEMQALQQLKELHLNCNDDSLLAVGLAQPLQPGLNDGLMKFFKCLTNLQTLSLSIACTRTNSKHKTVFTAIVSLKAVFGKTTLPNLRNLCLDSFWLESDELCTFLLRHQKTLMQLTLANIVLGGTEAVFNRWPEQNMNIKTLPTQSSRTDRYTTRRYTNPEVQTFPAWKQVARACQALSKLEGLKIDAAAETEDWTMLSVFDIEELQEEGMCGRKNSMVPHCDGGVLASLDKMYI